jgi:hypothetical protein
MKRMSATSEQSAGGAESGTLAACGEELANSTVELSGFTPGILFSYAKTLRCAAVASFSVVSFAAEKGDIDPRDR